MYAEVKPALLRYAPAVLSALAHPLVHGGVIALLTLAAVAVAAVRAVGGRLGLVSRGPERRAGGRDPCGQRGAPKWWSSFNLLDATAHSSMWEDLQRGRPSEVSACTHMRLAVYV